jgi:ADP-heptose:LPS heptosyltransferase
MHLLVIRTSAMGDVALTAPVIKALRDKYPDLSVTLVTKSAFAPFFASIDGLKLYLPDLNGRHKGVIGIVRLFDDLKKQGKIDQIIDLHDVIRTKVLRIFFKISGIQVRIVNKGRSEKKDIIKGKKRTGLRHTVERYCDVFAAAGFTIEPAFEPSIIAGSGSLEKIAGLHFADSVKNIGVAPYAKHKLKMWPEDYMISLLGMISEKYKVKFWLFGALVELARLNNLSQRLQGSYVVAGKLNLEEELALISRLSFMISMDSSNMHMAALCGTKVISIWGGTDPVTGFGAWQQPEEYSVRIPAEELDCRPCTVYGKGKCKRGDFACMMWLTPEIVYKKIVSLGIF